MLNWKRSIAFRALLTAIIPGLLVIVGCAPSNVKSEGMIPDQITVLEQHSGTVLIHVDGGRDDHAMDLPQISNEVFLEALKKAVKQSGIFTAISEGEDGSFRIDAFIFNLSQPFFVRNPVHLEIGWKLIRMDTSEIIWQESLTTTDSGFSPSNGSDSQSYNITKAVERAAQKNIKMALEQMSKVAF